MIKKVLACVFVVLVIGFVYNNWDRLTNLDRLLNNVVDKNNETTQVVNRLTRNEEAIINSIDSLSKSIKEVNNNVDRRFNSLDNKINKVKNLPFIFIKKRTTKKQFMNCHSIFVRTIVS